MERGRQVALACKQRGSLACSGAQGGSWVARAGKRRWRLHPLPAARARLPHRKLFAAGWQAECTLLLRSPGQSPRIAWR